MFPFSPVCLVSVASSPCPPLVLVATFVSMVSLYYLQEYSLMAGAHEAIGSLFAHPPTNINDHLPSLKAYAAMRRRVPRRRFVREMVIGILLGPVTRFEWSPRHTGAPGPRRGPGGGKDRFKRSQGGRIFLDPRQPRECSRIWRKIVTATRIYLHRRNRLRTT